MWKPQGILSKFILKQPTLLFGSKSIMGLKNYPCAKVAIIHGIGLSEELSWVINSTLSAFEIKYISKTWKGEPSYKELSSVVKELEILKPDLIIAIGGGSVIDGAKMARVLYEFPSFDIEYPNFSLLEWKTKFIVMPTTIGSGAEVSSASVLYNNELKTKEVIVNHDLIPDVVIYDPQLISDSSETLIMSSLIDSISHIIEGYVSNVDNPLVDVFAEKGLQIINDLLSIPLCDLSPSDFNRLQLSGYFGGIVQNHCIVGAAHAIAHQLTYFGFSHTSSISITLPAVIKINSQDKKIKAKYELLAKNSGIRNGIGGILDLIHRIKLKMNGKKEFNRFLEIKGQLIEDKIFINNAISDVGGKGNPLLITADLIKQIIEEIN
jgi:alcohol dehydrogenase